ncbi:MAG TPA: sodium:proton exchanger [Alphaproteobacteria bacterium]|nr:sodium:proton exchanger [Alphaproteobacteria bacterium]
MIYLMAIAGLALLLLTGDLLVRGAVGVACRLGIPPLVIGLTIVAFGTSAPELMICIQAALAGSPGIAIGNVVGSNIANVFLVLGIPAMIYPIACNQPRVMQNALMMLAASFVFAGLAYTGQFGFAEGAFLMALVFAFLWYSAKGSRQAGVSDEELLEVDGVSATPHSLPMALALILAGLVGLPLGAHLLISGATEIAREFQVGEEVIGLSMVAIGTSLPELATTLAAAFRRHCDVAIGNVIGSNVFNLLAIMGATAMVAPVPVPAGFLVLDIWVMIFAAIILLPFILRNGRINLPVGVLFMVAYISYLVFIFYDGRKMMMAIG